MPDPERAMLSYLELAVISQEKQQPLGRDRFLVLAGANACRAGLLTIAEDCRELILSENPQHLLRNYTSFAEAMRADDFEPLLKQLTRLCPVEQAEFLQSASTDEQHEESLPLQERAGQMIRRLRGDVRRKN